MGGADHDENDPLAGRDASETMDQRHPHQRPSPFGLARHRGDFGLGHARIMLKLKRRKPPALVAAQSDEAHHRADVGSPADEAISLLAGVEILPLNADPRH